MFSWLFPHIHMCGDILVCIYYHADPCQTKPVIYTSIVCCELFKHIVMINYIIIDLLQNLIYLNITWLYVILIESWLTQGRKPQLQRL